MTEAIRAQRVIVMDGGKILLDGTPQEVFPNVEALQSAGLNVPATTQLLYALRPFLKDGKQDKVERAARLARLITIGKRFLTEGGGLPV